MIKYRKKHIPWNKGMKGASKLYLLKNPRNKTVNCKYCEKPFQVYLNKIKTGRGKYCSRECFYLYLASKKNNFKHICKYCKKVFYSDERKRKFCSQKCHYLSRIQKIPKLNCKLCGKPFYKKWKSELKRAKFCSLNCKSIYNKKYIVPNKDTLIERLVESYLKSNNIPFTKQCPVAGISLVDFLLPRKIIIQCDGDYWHSVGNRKERDANQDLIFGFKGYKVWRFSETEIKETRGSCVEKIFKGGRNERCKEAQKSASLS